jgi:hypothetical protein
MLYLSLLGLDITGVVRGGTLDDGSDSNSEEDALPSPLASPTAKYDRFRRRCTRRRRKSNPDTRREIRSIKVDPEMLGPRQGARRRASEGNAPLLGLKPAGSGPSVSSTLKRRKRKKVSVSALSSTADTTLVAADSDDGDNDEDDDTVSCSTATAVSVTNGQGAGVGGGGGCTGEGVELEITCPKRHTSGTQTEEFSACDLAISSILKLGLLSCPRCSDEGK